MRGLTESVCVRAGKGRVRVGSGGGVAVGSGGNGRNVMID